MKKLLIIIIVSMLTACYSIQPMHQELDNSKLLTLTNCDQIQQSIQDMSKEMDDLKIQKNRANIANAVNTGAALLSLNPFALLYNNRTAELDKSIKSYTDRLDMLNKLHTDKCISNTLNINMMPNRE